MQKVILKGTIVLIALILSLSLGSGVQAGGLPGCSDLGMTGSGIFENPCIVTTKSGLISINDSLGTLDLSYKLGNDINLENTEWAPIGTSDLPFRGNFDGGGFSITNLSITGINSNVGLFGYVLGNDSSNTVLISNVSIDSGSVAGAGNVGGLIGYASYVTVQNVSSSVSISGVSRGGGLVGKNDSYLSIDNSYTTGNVITTGDFAGGLLGDSVNYSNSITNSFTTGNVTGRDFVGGLTGFSNDNSIIRNSYTTGIIDGENNIGGICGLGGNIISNSFSTGSVSGLDRAGGIAGTFEIGVISNVYSTGAITGTENTGGIVGLLYGATIENAYNLGSVTGVDAVGGLVGQPTSNSIISGIVAIGSVTGSTDVGKTIGNDWGTTTHLNIRVYDELVIIPDVADNLDYYSLVTANELNEISFWNTAEAGTFSDDHDFDLTQVENGYYPLLKKFESKNSMPGQTYIDLPEAVVIPDPEEEPSEDNVSSISLRVDGESCVIELGSTFETPLATASVHGTSLTNEIHVTGDVDSSKEGTYQLEYSVSHDGEWISEVINVKVEDTVRPVFWRIADQVIYRNTDIDWTILLGRVWDSSNELVKTSEIINYDVNGYKVAVTVCDESGNEGVSDADITVSDDQSDFRRLNYKVGKGYNFEFDIKQVLGYYEAYKMKLEYIVNEVDFDTEGTYMVVVRTSSVLRSARIETIFVDIVK